MKKIATRKLKETSWLAQIIRDKMDVEGESKGYTARWDCFTTLLHIVHAADDPNDENITYDNYKGKRQIIIRDIPSMMEHGYDFDREGMRCKLRGLTERYKDDDGNYLISLLTTNDLNSATIKDVAELMFQMETH